MTRNINTNDDEQTENSTDQNADADEQADAEQEQEQDANAEQDGADGAEQDANADVDRFGGTGLSTSDLTELTPFDAEALSEMSDSEVAFISETTTRNHATDGSREAYIDAITATLAQVEPDHDWADPAALRDHADDMDELRRVAQLLESSRGVSVVERAEGNEGPRSDGTLANHRARQAQNAHANAASGRDVNANSTGNGGGSDFGLNPEEWRDDSGGGDGEGPATAGTMADYRERKAGLNTNAADDGAPASLRVGQRTVYHGEDAYYAEVRRRKKKGDWGFPEPAGFHQYRQRIKSKDAENGGV